MQNNTSEQTPFVPFTKQERIQQLGEVDRKITGLLRYTGNAIDALGAHVRAEEEDEDSTGHAASAADADSDGPLSVFAHEMDDFLHALRAINVGMKRQIWGLEEAGIVTSEGAGASKETAVSSQSQSQSQSTAEGAGVGGGGGEVAAHATGPSLKPDGDGRIGGLDVGWLNSRSDKVERDMEGDLWNDAEKFVLQVLERQRLDSAGARDPLYD
ncbi:mediator complex, subunit Med11 [Hypoxylon fuscum]|nr:mediator complex, subunit Med11 [Hypoxylon fuscum]